MPQESCCFVLELEIPDTPGMLGKVTTVIGEAGGNIGVIDTIDIDAKRGVTIRRYTVTLDVADKFPDLLRRIRAVVPAVKIAEALDLATYQVMSAHLGGKLRVEYAASIINEETLARIYTPGVALVCQAIQENPTEVWRLTGRGNCVAIVTDGSRVLGLGNLGPEAALPVMEGKAVIFKWRAKIDAIPLVLATQDSEEIIRRVRAVQSNYGAINLEDIASPKCFEIEEKLTEILDIPVLHDDQHATAIAVLAGLLNALRLVGKRLETAKIVVCGAGAAGVATTKLLSSAGATNILCCDKAGIIYRGAPGLHQGQRWVAENTNPSNIRGDLATALKKADVFIGLSMPNILTVEMVRVMNSDPIIFALANPVPEIDPQEVLPYAAVVATGRSGFPGFNLINNALVFPGFFRGLLDARARKVIPQMKLDAAYALAGLVAEKDLSPRYIIPSIFDHRVVPAIANAVMRASEQNNQA